MNRVTRFLIVGLLAAGCTRSLPVLSPAPTASLTPGLGQSATATTAGVRLVARADAW